MGYSVGVDIGTTFTAAAICRDERCEMIDLGGRAHAMPSVVAVLDDHATIVGDAAERRARTDPTRVAREFKRRLGDTTPLITGGSPQSPERLMARLLTEVVDTVTRQEGGAPVSVAVTHPANWGPYKRELFEHAVELADVHQAILLTEPEAAATHYASLQRIEPGSVVAVYDLGGGTFDAVVLDKTGDGFEVISDARGIERLGGVDFDASIFAHVTAAAGLDLDSVADGEVVRASVSRLRKDVTEAKEALSADTTAALAVVLPGVNEEVRLTRIEFEEMIRPALADTIRVLESTIRSSGLEVSDIDAILLAGGSARIPLVAQMVGELGRPVNVDVHPKNCVALGAARRAADLHASTTGSPVPGEVAADGHDPGGDPETESVPDPTSDRADARPAEVIPPLPPAPPHSPGGHASGDQSAVDQPGGDQPSGEETTGRRVGALLTDGRAWPLAAMAVVAAIAVAAIVVLVSGDSGERMLTAGRTVSGVEVNWMISDGGGDGIVGEVGLLNDSSRPADVTFDLVIPKGLAEDVSQVVFEPSPTEIVDPDPVVRYELSLGGGESVRLIWSVDEPVEPWTEAGARQWLDDQAMITSGCVDEDDQPGRVELLVECPEEVTPSTTSTTTSTRPSSTTSLRATTTTQAPRTTVAPPPTTQRPATTTTTTTTTTTIPPILTRSAGTVRVGASLSFALSNPPSAIAAPTWTFGDGSSTAGLDASHAWSAPGDYTVAVTYQDCQGCPGSSQLSTSIEVLPGLPSVSIGGGTTLVVNQQFFWTVTYQNAVTGTWSSDCGVQNPVWEPGDGWGGSYGGAPRTCSLSLTVENSIGETASTTKIFELVDG